VDEVRRGINDCPLFREISIRRVVRRTGGPKKTPKGAPKGRGGVALPDKQKTYGLSGWADPFGFHVAVNFVLSRNATSGGMNALRTVIMCNYEAAVFVGG
jgi:hypothetical protein